MRNLPPADELAQIRDAMRRLKIREAVLRRMVLDDPALRDGIDARVVVRLQKRRTLEVARLPDHIRNDSRFWSMSESQVVLVESRGGAAASAPRAKGAHGDQRAKGAPPAGQKRPSAAFDWDVPDDAEVIEPF